MQLSEGPAAEDDAAVNRSPDGQGEYNDEREREREREVEVEDECDSEVRSELPAIEREDQRREDFAELPSTSARTGSWAESTGAFIPPKRSTACSGGLSAPRAALGARERPDDHSGCHEREPVRTCAQRRDAVSGANRESAVLAEAQPFVQVGRALRRAAGGCGAASRHERKRDKGALPEHGACAS
eukprot:scaffold803_cov310-Pinguiococcus_pyrenoidosus.AAC.14